MTKNERERFRIAAEGLRTVGYMYVNSDDYAAFLWCYPLLHDDLSCSFYDIKETVERAAQIGDSLSMDGV